MIEVSCQSIDYLPDQLTQSLTVTNKGQTQIIYKVKTNNIKAIDARPNTGVIAPNSNAKISIKRNQSISQNVKLQFTYLQCQQNIQKDNKDIFKQAWAKHQRNQQSKTFPVRIVSQVRKQPERFSNISSNQSDPNLFQSIVVSRSSKTQELNQQKKENQTSTQPNRKQKSQQAARSSGIEKKIQEQKAQNAQLKLKMSQKQAEIKRTSLLNKELQVDRLLANKQCKKFHLSISSLVIAALLFFSIGYYLGYSGNQPNTLNNQV